MAEYIERKRAIVDACNSLELYPSEYAKLEDALNEIPASDVEPVRHGRWLDNEDYMFCSCCGVQWNYCDNDTQDFNFCPNCGADMRESKEG